MNRSSLSLTACEKVRQSGCEFLELQAPRKTGPAGPVSDPKLARIPVSAAHRGHP